MKNAYERDRAPIDDLDRFWATYENHLKPTQLEWQPPTTDDARETTAHGHEMDAWHSTSPQRGCSKLPLHFHESPGVTARHPGVLMFLSGWRSGRGHPHHWSLQSELRVSRLKVSRSRLSGKDIRSTAENRRPYAAPRLEERCKQGEERENETKESASDTQAREPGTSDTPRFAVGKEIKGDCGLHATSDWPVVSITVGPGRRLAHAMKGRAWNTSFISDGVRGSGTRNYLL